MSSKTGDELWDSTQVSEHLGIHRVTLWNWVKGKKFPPPDLAEGRKFRRWRESTVQKWKDSK